MLHLNSKNCLRARAMQDIGRLTQEQKAISAKLEKVPLQEEFDALKTGIKDFSRRMDKFIDQLDKMPDTPPRTLATGETARRVTATTDC